MSGGVSQSNKCNFPSQTSDVYNWCHVHQLATQSQVFRPSTIPQILSLFKHAKIRCIGSGLSFEQVHGVSCEDDAILIDMCEYNGMVQYNSSDHTVVYRAGTKLEDVFRELQHDYGRILPCSPGVIAIQTLAGAISTSTHGQGLFQSSLADAVTQITVAQPGAVINTYKRGDAEFGAYITSLGCLGVIIDITLETSPDRVFTCLKQTYSFNDMLEQFARQNETNEFCKAWWFPGVDVVHVWKVNQASDKDSQRFLATDRTTTIKLSPAQTDLNALVESTKDKMSLDTKSDRYSPARHYETVNRFKDASNVCGSIYQIMCKGIPVPQINCEVAVPFDKMNACLLALNTWYKQSGASLHYPFILRCTGASEAWLSPAYHKRVCWIGSLIYLASDGTAVAGGMAWLQAIQEVIAQFDGLPHLGKHYRPELYAFESLLPKWNDFIRLRRSIDPCNQLSNSFIENLFSQHKHAYIEASSLTRLH